MVSIQIQGLPKAKRYLDKKGREVLKVANKAIHKAGFFLEGEVKESIAGRKAEIRSVDTGRFLQSVRTNNTKMQSTVSSDLSYAKYLEHGTRRIKARRHFQNSASRNKSKISGYIQSEIKKIV